ncbi:MAG: sugar phosphate isomerase/epimerase [Chloroflexi bacterium HGW-Chloroflexi-5]|jgi:sugar phosphate isomerase/epimerase|nr:MAG: sugar phosphate isomerase/epimerase [Chloroflexi bacterium HGW-Chloroflexi-5]
MGKILLGINMEFVRSHDKPFDWGVAKAAEIGYQYLEPMVHWGRELLSEARYFHSVSMFDDPRWARDLCDKHNIKMSGVSAHTPLCKPEISVEYLKQAIRWASDAGAPVVNTDEGPKPEWTTREMDYTLMSYTLKEASMVAERYGIKIGIEPHQQYSKSQEGLDSIYDLVKSPSIGINYDTGNSYLAGTTDTYDWLSHVTSRLVHLHAKDISFSQSGEEKGKVSGTPVGCACGDGVVDWKRMIEIAKNAPTDIVFSVECGTVPDAIRSFEHLSKLL